MNRFTAQLMELALANFPPALLAPDGADALRAISGALSPWRMLYFECRLSAAGGGVDVSQHFHASNGGADALLKLAQRRLGEVGGNDAAIWRRIATLADLWKSDPGLAGSMTEVCLEYDVDASGTWQGVPALFASFACGLLADREQTARFIETVLPSGQIAWDRMLETLESAARYGLNGGRMVGVMLSRAAELRCMIGNLTPEPVRAFLDDIGWSGDIPALVELLSQPELGGGGVLFVLGHGPELSADCGLEIIYGQDETRLPERAALLQWLTGRGLADPVRAAALALWDGPLTPANAGADWPDALIARSLVEGAERLLYLRRFVNHLKLNIRDGAVVATKAYLALAPVEWTMRAASDV